MRCESGDATCVSNAFGSSCGFLSELHNILFE